MWQNHTLAVTILPHSGSADQEINLQTASEVRGAELQYYSRRTQTLLIWV
jgi:hypothetical protein